MKNRLLIVLSMAVFLPATASAQGLSLAECLALSEENNHSLKSARYGLEEARAQQREARWEYFPRVQVSGYGFRAVDPLLKVTLRDVLGNSDQAHVLTEQLTSAATENGIKPYYSALQKGYGAGVVALQPVYAGGRIVSGNALARLGVSAGEIQERMTSRAVRDSVESKYWRIVALQEKEKTLAQASLLLAELEKEVSGAVRSGVATETDLLKVQLKQRELEAGRHRLEGSIGLLKMDLFDEIGYSYRYLDLPSITLTDPMGGLEPPAHWLDEAAEAGQTDESRLLSMQVDAEKLQKQMAVGELRPQVAVGAGYGYGALMRPDQGDFNGMVFATAQIPLTDLGKAVERSRRYDAKIRQAEEERDYLESRLDLQLKMLRLEMETTWKELEAARDAATLAGKTLSQQQTAFRSGRITAAELLETELEAITAEEDLLGREIAYRLAVNAYRSRLSSGGAVFGKEDAVM